MRKLHVKTYDIERKPDLVEVKLKGELVATWEPLLGLRTAGDMPIDHVEEHRHAIAQSCIHEWIGSPVTFERRET